MEKSELSRILDLHQKFLKGEEGGEKASLSGERLQNASLAGANLTGANLKGADLGLGAIDQVVIEGAIMPDGKVYDSDFHNLWKLVE